jgi:hypothetical protein
MSVERTIQFIVSPLQFLARELADQWVAVEASAFLGTQERLVHQRGQHGDGSSRHPRGRFPGEPAGEHRQPPEGFSLLRAQEVPGVLEGGPQPRVALGNRAGLVFQEVEPALRLARDLLCGHEPQAGGGQLDAEWETVHQAADRADVGYLLVAGIEAGTHAPPLLNEEPDGVLMAS